MIEWASEEQTVNHKCYIEILNHLFPKMKSARESIFSLDGRGEIENEGSAEGNSR